MHKVHRTVAVDEDDNAAWVSVMNKMSTAGIKLDMSEHRLILKLDKSMFPNKSHWSECVSAIMSTEEIEEST